MDIDADEVAMELLDIFLDFGTPAKLILSRPSFMFFDEVFAVLKEMYSGFENLVITTRSSRSRFSARVCTTLVEWMQEGDRLKHVNWSIPCHLLQWKLNNILDETGNTPYSSTFECSNENFESYADSDETETLTASDVNDQSDLELHTEEDLGVTTIEMKEEKAIIEDTMQIEEDEVNAISGDVEAEMDDDNVESINLCENLIKIESVDVDLLLDPLVEPMPSTSKDYN
ncbi:uncharacterized protein ACR2FA_003686 [Aphomia sociella]